MTTQMRFEVTALPVADIDRAKAFYEGLGCRLDADFMLDENTRAVQLAPPARRPRSTSARTRRRPARRRACC